MDLTVDPVIDIICVGCVYMAARGVKDPLVHAACSCSGKPFWVPYGVSPNELVKVVLIFVNQAIVIEELFTHLFCHTAANFPSSRGEVAAEGEATGDIKDVGYDIAECANRIGVVLELAKHDLTSLA
jgi:hypothetical protein